MSFRFPWTLAMLMVSGVAAAEPAAPYCTVFDPNSSTLEIPCLAAGGTAYKASLSLTSASPLTFGVRSLGASGLAPTPGQCAVFEPSTTSIGLPCVVVGTTRMWAKLKLEANSSLSLVGAGGAVTNDCQPLVDAPAGAQVSITATGEASGTVARALVRNTTAQQQCYCVLPGHALRNTDTRYQNLGIIKSASVCVQPGQQSEMSLDGSCLNSALNTPTAGQTMTLYRDSRADLSALLQAIERERTDMNQIPVITFAVWALTDADNPIAGTLNSIKQMFRLAGLDPAQYPGLANEIQIPVIPTFPLPE
jgi:hypothetical protein